MVRPAQPSFLRLDPRIGWRMAPTSTDVRTDPVDGHIRLGSPDDDALPLTEPAGSFGGLTLPTGVVILAGGGILVADPARGVVLGYPNQALFGTDGERAPGFTPLWPAPTDDETGDPPDMCRLPAAPMADAVADDPYVLVNPRGLAISPDGDLVVADSGALRLVVYTWPALAVRTIIDMADGEPWDIAFDSRGRLHVADRLGNRIRRFDRIYREDTDYQGGSGTLSAPVHLAIDAEDTVFVVDRQAGRARLTALDDRGRRIEPSPDPYGRTFPAPLVLDGDAMRLPPGPCGDPGAPLRNVTVDRRGRLPPGGPHLLALPRRARFPRRGVFLSEALDSGTFNFAWHRLILEAEVPATTALEVESFTAARMIEPERLVTLPEQAWSRRIIIAPEDDPELLLQSPPGRYLWLRLRLIGDGTATPRIGAATVLGPRESALSLLPPVFHEDAVSRDFLDRYLSYFDTVFDEVERGIEDFGARLDPDAVPTGPFLSWLAGWFDIRFFAEWPEATRRAFLRNAMTLHRQRGTVAGLSLAIRLHAGLEPPLPVILEDFRLRDYAGRRDDGGSGLIDGAPRLAGFPLIPPESGTAHRFTLVMPAASAPDAAARAALVRLVDLFRPAHTAWRLFVVAPGVRIACQSTIGVDTLLGGYPSAPLGDMQIGRDSRLADPDSTAPTLGQAVLQAGHFS